MSATMFCIYGFHLKCLAFLPKAMKYKKKSDLILLLNVLLLVTMSCEKYKLSKFMHRKLTRVIIEKSESEIVNRLDG